MRPEILFPLFAPTTSLPGIGPRLAGLLVKACGEHVVDLLWHLPREIVDRRFAPKIADAPPDRIVTITVTIDRHEPPPDRRRPYRIQCSDDTGTLSLVYFHADRAYLERLLPVGETRLVSGRIEIYRDKPQMPHPDYVVAPAQKSSIPDVEAVYPLTAGLTPKVMLKAVREALKRAPVLPDWLDPAYRQRTGWPDWQTALLTAHNPDSLAALEPDGPARQRLAYDELLASQLALAIMRSKARGLPGRKIVGDKRLRKKVLDALPFKLTGSQIEALKEIGADMASEKRMLRLLQGDVGSGKTLVALFAMLNAIECGGQTALLAPTEILARQHFDTIAPLAEAAGVTLRILTGRNKGKARQEILAALSAGEIDILIGTHAIVQDDIAFKDLTFAVVDEQHRFGVHQRLALSNKSDRKKGGADLLVMTATPIPRTLMLSAYGDLDVSRLRDKPPGRKPIDTRLVQNSRLEQVIDAVKRKIDGGGKVFWVCPLVEESETLDVAAAEDRYADLLSRYGENRVALVHGRMKAKEKDGAMLRFVDGPAQILVATTVIEVGVDVPEASVMVVEHAERFGLAQLHQLRGRIGRGDTASTCLLVYGRNLTATAERRLRTMRDTEDGFVIAEEDLKLRGAGELLGTRQSGLPVFRLADLAVHDDLLQTARDDARLVIDRDPDLKSERGKSLRILLYLFERDSAVATLRSG
ncbi:MAG: ATP-dependent DNA helicase RecG [Alphaproteobacteria bacterium]